VNTTQRDFTHAVPCLIRSSSGGRNVLIATLPAFLVAANTLPWESTNWRRSMRVLRTGCGALIGLHAIQYVAMIGRIGLVWQALAIAGAMAWEILWALILGFLRACPGCCRRGTGRTRGPCRASVARGRPRRLTADGKVEGLPCTIGVSSSVRPVGEFLRGRSMRDQLVRGVVAGATGTVALNVLTYLDQAVRGRPGQHDPEQTAGELAGRAGLDLGAGYEFLA
jgi:hypothetical protein